MENTINNTNVKTQVAEVREVIEHQVKIGDMNVTDVHTNKKNQTVVVAEKTKYVGKYKVTFKVRARIKSSGEIRYGLQISAPFKEIKDKTIRLKGWNHNQFNHTNIRGVNKNIEQWTEKFRNR